MQEKDNFQKFLDYVRQSGEIQTYSKLESEGVFSIEIDAEVNSTNFLAIRELADGAKYDASCLLKVEFLPIKEELQYWAYEVGLDMLFTFHGLGYTRVSKIDHFEDHLLYRFLQLSKEKKDLKAIYGILVGSGPDYVERNTDRHFPKLEDNELFGELVDFYRESKDDFVASHANNFGRRDLSNIIYRS